MRKPKMKGRVVGFNRNKWIYEDVNEHQYEMPFKFAQRIAEEHYFQNISDEEEDVGFMVEVMVGTVKTKWNIEIKYEVMFTAKEVT